MKKILLVLAVLVLTTVACSLGGTEPQVVEKVVVVTATPEPTAIPTPTDVPTAVPPTATPAPTVLDVVDAIFAPYGFVRSGYDIRGENNCGRDYCIHYKHPDAPGLFPSFYVENGRFMGIVVSFPVGSKAPITTHAAEFSVHGMVEAGVPMDDISCGATVTYPNTKTCGSILIRTMLQDGYLFWAYNPTAAFGPALPTHTSPSSANSGPSL